MKIIDFYLFCGLVPKFSLRASLTPNLEPGWPNLEPRSPNLDLRWPQDLSTWSQEDPKTSQLGAKMAPRWTQDLSTWSQDPPIWSQDGPKTPNSEPRPANLEQRWPQDAQCRAKMVKDDPNMINLASISRPRALKNKSKSQDANPSM